MTLGEKIWRLRESQHMSQEELAEKLGVSRQTVSNWENDKAVLDAEKLAKLCTIFGVSADEMLNRPVAPNKRTAGRSFIAIIILAVIALVLIIVATAGLIFCGNEKNYSSVITFGSNFVWVALLVLGIAALIVAVVVLLKKK